LGVLNWEGLLLVFFQGKIVEGKSLLINIKMPFPRSWFTWKKAEEILSRTRNKIGMLYRSGSVKTGQLLQLIIQRGGIQDVNGYVFPNVIKNSFHTGLKEIWEVVMESRAGIRAQISSKPILKILKMKREL